MGAVFRKANAYIWVLKEKEGREHSESQESEGAPKLSADNTRQTQSMAGAAWLLPCFIFFSGCALKELWRLQRSPLAKSRVECATAPRSSLDSLATDKAEVGNENIWGREIYFGDSYFFANNVYVKVIYLLIPEWIIFFHTFGISISLLCILIMFYSFA